MVFPLFTAASLAAFGPLCLRDKLGAAPGPLPMGDHNLETAMKALLFLPLAAALTVPALASESGSAPSGRVCIYSRDIRSTTIPDNHTIVFRL